MPSMDSDAAFFEEYKKGFIICPICKRRVEVLDRETREWSDQKWWNHLDWQCSLATRRRTSPSFRVPGYSSTPPSQDNLSLATYTPQSTTHDESSAYVPAKTLRPKTSEQERINKLSADPYVAQYDAFRVLCALCDQWVKLKLHTTYHLTRWEEHREICCAQRKKGYTVDRREAIFAHDPYIQKFDLGRVLCMICGHLLEMPARDPYLADQIWLYHRAECSKDRRTPVSSGGYSFTSDAEIFGSQNLSDARYFSGSSVTPNPYSTDPNSVRLSSNHDQNPSDGRHGETWNYSGTYVASPLEPSSRTPHCTLASSFQDGSMVSRLPQASDNSNLDQAVLQQFPQTEDSQHTTQAEIVARIEPVPDGEDPDMLAYPDPTSDQRETVRESTSFEGSRDVGRENVVIDETSTGGANYHNGNPGGSGKKEVPTEKRSLKPIRLANLNSAVGRKQFVASEILYLFTTTYQLTDDLPISSLVNYLNSAMPVDKYEDFDTTEVVKYVTALSSMSAWPTGSKGKGGRGCDCGKSIGERKWRIGLEGDIIRMLD